MCTEFLLYSYWYMQYLYIKTVDVKCQQKDLLSSQKLDFLNIWFDPLQPLNNSCICQVDY